MSKTILDVQDALLTGNVRARVWLEEFEREFFKPLSDLFLVSAWAGLSEEDKAALRNEKPKEVAAIEEYVESIGG